MIAAFTLFLALLMFLPSSLLNAISQTLILVMLLVYLASGIKRLLKLWLILTFYEAFVLLITITFQFVVNSPGHENSRLFKKYDGMSDSMKLAFKWLGFYPYQDPIWLELAPYVVLFSLSVLLNKNFKRKAAVGEIGSQVTVTTRETTRESLK